MDHIAIIVGLSEMLLGWSLFLIEKKRVQSILTSFCRIDQIQTRLRIKEDFEKHYFRLAITLMICNCLIIIRNNSWILLVHCDDLNFFIYGLLSIIPMNIEILFLWIVFIVREMFQHLNEKIKNCLNYRRSSWSKSTSETSLEIEDNSSWLLSRQIVTFSRLHREIRNVVRLTRDHFALLLFLNRLKQLCRFTTCVHVTYRYLKNCQYFNWEDSIYMLHASVWIITLIIFMYIFSDICGSMTKEANDTGNLLHAFLNKCSPLKKNEEIAKLNIFLFDLLQNNITISLLGLVEANYFLVYSRQFAQPWSHLM
ncbi:uncharacterized protein [Venturia canescens]|uniref:uncharacterized protein n=1 Tax=Venturia canescens TaxID=32260 RepID=UPI001C9C470F|nr:uncharacterized protein LOC122416531 [Venturia canescens]